MKSGGILKDYHKVTEIIPGERVTVKTYHGDFSAKRVIITAGPWTPKIMRQLGVELPVMVRLFGNNIPKFLLASMATFTTLVKTFSAKYFCNTKVLGLAKFSPTKVFCYIVYIHDCIFLSVQVTRAEILYWKVENPEHFSAEMFPIFKEVVTKDERNIQQFYNGIPVLEYPGLLKVIR